MNILSFRTRSTPLFIAIFVLIAAGVSFGSIEDSLNKSFTVEPGGLLTIDTARGSIEVRGTEGKRVDIEVVRKAKTSDQNEANEIFNYLRLDFNQSGNDVIIKGIKTTDSNKKLNKLNVKFILTVPLNYNVDLETSGGSISVDDL